VVVGLIYLCELQSEEAIGREGESRSQPLTIDDRFALPETKTLQNWVILVEMTTQVLRLVNLWNHIGR
jgi:hypothetical protein